jgi:PEP-CTERM motif
MGYGQRKYQIPAAVSGCLQNLKTPVFTFDPATSTGSVKAFTGVNPNADFVSVSAFNGLADASIGLLFETTILNFNGNTFFTEDVTLPGEITISAVTTLSPLPFLSFFASGAAAPIPEASTWAMMLLGFGGLGFLGYRQTRRAKLQAV